MKACLRLFAFMAFLICSSHAQVADFPLQDPLTSPVFGTIDFPGAFATHAYGVNNSARIVGSYDVQNGVVTHAFLYEAGGIRNIDPPRSFGWAEANSINNRGAIAGDHGSQEGFIWRGGTYKRIALDSLTSADSVNDAGMIVGFFASGCCSLHGFFYNPKVHRVLQIDYPGALRTIAEGINSSNTIVGIWRDTANVIHGFVRESGTISNFDLPGAAQTYLFSINTAGTMAGSYMDTAGIIHGFIYQNGVSRTVDFPGAITTSVYGMNDFGMIVGDYADGNGVTHGFFASL
jgi:uncharacterized membrane protein